LGPNGAGKTTFVSIVAGLRPGDAGDVWVAGVDAIAQPREAAKFLGLAPQDLAIYPTLPVRRNLAFWGEIAGLRGAELDRQIDEVGEALSLTPMFDRRAGQLSGGQKRRLHTGMALVHKPPLLMLDEPTVGADIRTRQEILDVVKKLAEEGHAVVYSTHYLPEVEALGASVAVLEGGKIIARGSIAELVAQHSSPALELHFQGPAPELVWDGPVTRQNSMLRIGSENPAAIVPSVLGRLGHAASRLASVEVIQPSLESVYLALTEKRYSGIGNLPEELQPLELAGIPSPAPTAA
jgi:ABC-2 type transport system ATP-binding protein